MTMKQIKALFLAVALFGSAGVLAACEEEGPAEKAGKELDNAGEEMGEALEEFGDEVEEQTDGARE